MKATCTTAGSHAAVAKYRNCPDEIIGTCWSTANLEAIADGRPWRKFPWYLGQRNYSGYYWSATERALVGYESRLELARLILADFDIGVKRIASQPSFAAGFTGLTRVGPDSSIERLS